MNRAQVKRLAERIAFAAEYEVRVAGRSWDGFTIRRVAEDVLAADLLPRPRTAAEKATKAAKQDKRATKRQRTRDVRAQVMERANLVCECGCGRWFRGLQGRATLDHYWGKAKAPETIETTWALREDCHLLGKTLNNPSSAEWHRKFIAHCERHGYAVQAALARRKLEAEQLVEQAAAVGGGR